MPQPDFQTEFVTTPDALRAAQALRYDVFVAELGGQGAGVDHDAGLECDAFDAFSSHLLLRDRARSDDPAAQVVGVYRLMDAAQAARAGGFYSQREYDLEPLLGCGRKVLELGRSCLHADYRGGTAMYHLWSALAAYVLSERFEILFGVASFHGTDAARLAQPLSLLHHRHLAPEHLRPIARAPSAGMDQIPAADLDRKAAMIAIPALIKAYLRLGGFVGQGAYLDHAFNTTDVCLVLDVARMSGTQRKLYTKERA